MKLSVNILTWNNKDTITKVLDAAYCDVQDIEHEFVIVDNGSDDGTYELIIDWVQAHDVRNTVIRNSTNLGISKGKNAGIDASQGEYILMLDGDVVPVSNSIKCMLSWIEESGKHAIGMLPNKFVTSPDMATSRCDRLDNVREHKCACLFYGIYRRSIFDNGLRLYEEGQMGGPGYGWEDHDFYMRMKMAGIIQYAADINNITGRYFHAINSSIRAMGRKMYIDSSRARAKHFHEVWDAA